MNKLKFLCIGDPHIRLETLSVMKLMKQKLSSILVDESVDIIVVLGDVLHTHERLHTTALNEAVSFIEFLSDFAPTYVLVGNHDYIQNQQFLTSNHWMNALKSHKDVYIVDSVMKIEDAVFTPYVPVGRFEEALNTCQDWKTARIIFAHQEFRGCHMGAIVSTDGDQWSTSLPYVVSGHIHSNETLPEGVYYPGSSIQHAFGESTRNVIAIVTLTSERVPHIREIDLNLPRKITLYKSLEEASSIVIPKDENQYKVVFKGNHDMFKSFQKTPVYKQLSDECRVVFKPVVEMINHRDECIHRDNLFVSGFLENLDDNVRNTCDEYVYCIYQELVHGNVIDEQDILVIR